MGELSKITGMMAQKSRLLASVEEATQEMITCPSERLEALMTQRDKRVGELQKVDKEMTALCQEREDGGAILDAAQGRGDTGAYPEIQEEAQRQRAIFRRLRESELQAVLRLKQEQLEILEKIKTAGQSGAAKAARFYSLTGAQNSGGGSRFGNA